MPSSRARRRRSGVPLKARWLPITGGNQLAAVRQGGRGELIRFFDGPREVGIPVYGTPGAVNYYTNEDFSRYATLRAELYDKNGLKIARASVGRKRIDRFDSIVDVDRTPGSVVSGTFALMATASRGDLLDGSMVFYLYVDGELVAGPSFIAAVDGIASETFNVDSMRFLNGEREIHVYAYPTSPDPGDERWHTALDFTLVFSNGATAMAFLPDSDQIVVQDATPFAITGQILRCDGTRTAPAGAVSLATNDAAVASVAGANVTMNLERWATITATADGLSAEVRVARYPAGSTAIPHLGRNWQVRTTYDAALSRWVVAPFWLSPDEVFDDDLLKRLVIDARFALWARLGANIGVGGTLAAYQVAFDAEHPQNYWDQLTAGDFDTYLFGDDLVRQRSSLKTSITEADAGAAYQYAIEQWTTNASGQGVTMQDEAPSTYTGDPSPNDNRWNHIATGALTHVTSGAAIRDSSKVWVPADFIASTVPERRRRFFITSGAHAGKLCRISSAQADGSLLLGADPETGPDRYDPLVDTLAPGDTYIVGGWWADAIVPLEDSAVLDLIALLRGGTAQLPIGWAPAAQGGGETYRNWSLAEVANHGDWFSHLKPGNDQYVEPRGILLPQRREGKEFDIWPAQDATSTSIPWIGFSSVAGYFFIKGNSDPRDYFDPAVDIQLGGPGRVDDTIVSAGLSVQQGACMLRAYAFDMESMRLARYNETFPATVLPEPCQTGFHPYRKGAGTDKFWALGAFTRATRALQARVFGALGNAPSIAPGVRTSYRTSAAGRLYIAVNTRESSASTPALTLGARWHVGGSATRHRLVGMRSWTEHVAADGLPFSMEPGELTYLELHEAADDPKPAVRWVTPAIPAELQSVIKLRFAVSGPVPVSGIEVFVDGSSHAEILAPDSDGYYSVDFDGEAWTQDYLNDPRREVWVPLSAVATGTNGETCELRSAFILPAGTVQEPPPPAIPTEGMILGFTVDQGLSVNGSNQVTAWENQSLEHLYDISFIGTTPPVRQLHADGLLELYHDGVGDGRLIQGNAHAPQEVWLVVRRTTVGNFPGYLGMYTNTTDAILVGNQGTTDFYPAEGGWAVEIDEVATATLNDTDWHVIRLSRAAGPDAEASSQVFGDRFNNNRTMPMALRAWYSFDRITTDPEKVSIRSALAAYIP